MIVCWGGKVPLDELLKRLASEGYYVKTLRSMLPALGVAVDKDGVCTIDPCAKVRVKVEA